MLFLTSDLPSPCKGCFCVSEWGWAPGAVGEGSKGNGLVELLPGKTSLGGCLTRLGASPEVMVSGIEGTRTFSAFPPFFLAGLLTVFPADFHNILVMLLYVCIYLFISKMPQVFPNKSLKERTGKKARKQSWAQSQRSLTTAVAGRAQEAACT